MCRCLCVCRLFSVGIYFIVVAPLPLLDHSFSILTLPREGGPPMVPAMETGHMNGGIMAALDPETAMPAYRR